MCMCVHLSVSAPVLTRMMGGGEEYSERRGEERTGKDGLKLRSKGLSKYIVEKQILANETLPSTALSGQG